jgi:predicted Zn-dependent protease
VAAAPDTPALMDTLALAYAAEQQTTKAITLQQQALALQPDDPALRFNLARFYIQAREKRSAKAELDRLAALGGRFDRQPEVAAMLQGLGGR